MWVASLVSSQGVFELDMDPLIEPSPDSTLNVNINTTLWIV